MSAEPKDGIPLPPGGEIPDAKSVSAVVEPAEPTESNSTALSWWERAWLSVKSAAATAEDGVRRGCLWVLDGASRLAGKIGHGIYTAYSWTLRPILNFVEEWVPGCRYLRQASFCLALVYTFIAAVMGCFIMAQSAWYLVPLGLIIGPALFWIGLAIMPELWGQVALSAYMISAIGCAFGAVAEWLGGARFHEAMLDQFAPGFGGWLLGRHAPAQPALA